MKSYDLARRLRRPAADRNPEGVAFEYPVIEQQSSDVAWSTHLGDCREQQHGENYPKDGYRLSSLVGYGVLWRSAE
jgi:hypothetical protein